MFSKLKLLFKDTVIYGSSTILARSLNYLLVPLYANKLSTFDNGVQTIIYANIALANVLFSYGLETSYLKVVSDSAHRDRDETQLFSTAFLTLFITSTLFALAIVFFAPVIAELIGLSTADCTFVRYAALILWIDTLLVIPFAELRLKRKAVQFAIARVVGVIAVVVSAIVLIVPLKTGLPGVFIAEAFGSLVSLLLVIPVFRQFRIFFSAPQLREMLRIGLPYVPTGIAGLLIHLIDRNILIRIPLSQIEKIYGKGYQPSDIVGIYGRIAAFGVVLQLFIQVFRFAWQPFFLQHAKDPDAKRLFQHVLSISTFFTMFLALAATYFVPDLVRFHYAGSFYLLPPRYWIGLSIISGMDGAAYAIVAGTVVMCLVMAWYSLKVFPVPYDWLKLFLLFGAGMVLGWFQFLVEPKLPQAGAVIATKTALLFLYLACAVTLFREEATLVAVKLGNKFKRK